MASVSKPKPSTSRWGFLSQAVASVESKLDTILADDEVAPKQNTAAAASTKEVASAPRSSQDFVRSNTASQNNDRLQERLARAMAKKAAARSETPNTASEPVSRSSTPVNAEAESQLQSPLLPQEEPKDADGSTATIEPENLSERSEVNGANGTVENIQPTGKQQLLETLDDQDEAGAFPEHEDRNGSVQIPSQETPPPATVSTSASSAIGTSTQTDAEAYVERIDALNAKIQYLSQEVLRNPRETEPNVRNNAIDRKLADREQKIAELMEEGNKLSMAEMKHLAVIKKLKAQNAALSKEQSSTRERFAKLEAQLSLAGANTKKAEDDMLKTRNQVAALTKADRDIDVVSKERDALRESVKDLRAQVSQALTRAERAEAVAQDDKLELGKLKVTELEAEITELKAVLESSEQNFGQQIQQLRSSLNEEKESCRTMESEMLAEQAILEGRLEAFRIKAEEASSADDRDTQARLMRQMEVLQGQYATASQNWQGIEGTLLARIGSLEHDRNETAGRETDARKRLREATLRCKVVERELEELQAKPNVSMTDQSNESAEVARLNDKIQQLEQDLVATQKEAEVQRVRLERECAKKLEEERTKSGPPAQQAKLEFPINTSRKTSTYVVDQLMSPSHASLSRRSSALPSIVSDAIRQHSSSGRGYNLSPAPETPSMLTSPEEDYFDDIPDTPMSQDRQPSRRGLNDVMSTSTVGGGLSVQLVERMSANVRRLESEKAASKDEITRITTQRDDARQEVVQLMRDLEQKKEHDDHLKEVEKQLAELNTRHQTTLEILGEKTEQVEELKQDISDVKQMYRDLANHMK